MIAGYACNRCHAVYTGGDWWVVLTDVAISIAPWSTELAKYKPGTTEHYCDSCIMAAMQDWLTIERSKNLSAPS